MLLFPKLFLEITPEQMRALFSSYDADASGLIDRVEFEALLADLGEVLDDAETTAALAAIDTSADGNISFDEFTAWFNNPERARASEKGFVHQQLLRFKLMAKLHAQRASSLASSVRQQDDEAALAASTVQFTTDIDLGSVPDDAPMKIAAKNRIVGPDTVAEILAAHSVPAGNSMWAIDLALEPEATAEAKQDAIDFVRNMFAQFVPLPPFVAMDVALAAGNDGAECLRITVSVPCEMLPVDAVLGAQFEAQAGLAGQRGEVSFAVSFDDIISNPDFVIADAFGLRMRGQAAMLRGANDFLKAVNPIAGTAASLYV